MKFRVARHTTSLTPIIHFYTEVLGLIILGSFQDHNGYDGVFLGLKNADWHLEFTTSAGEPQHHADEDDLLVFYQDSTEAYEALTQKFQEHGIKPVTAKNPYWSANGTTYQDPDGYGIVITTVRQ